MDTICYICKDTTEAEPFYDESPSPNAIYEPVYLPVCKDCLQRYYDVCIGCGNQKEKCVLANGCCNQCRSYEEEDDDDD